MAKLLMADGSTRNVDYNKAAKIYQILTGNAKPDDKKQADFVATVRDVDFGNNVRLAPHPEFERTPTPVPHDEEIDKILADPKLKGRDRAAAVAKRIKERV